MAWGLSGRLFVFIFCASTATVGLASAQTGMVFPPEASRAIPGSVTLQGASAADTIRRLHVVRQLSVAAVRSNPIVALGRARLNFKPVFDNPHTLSNIAQRLRAIPQQVELLTDQSELVEVDQGLLLHNFISYRIKPGVCNDAARRQQLSNSGVNCFSQQNAQVRAAAFATKGDAHYVADPGKRAIAIATAQRAAQLTRTAINKYVADFRAMLADPVKRKQIEARIGAADAARMAQLDNTRLEQELVSAGERKVEEVLFVPNLDAALPEKINGMHIAPNPATAAQRRKMMFKAIAPDIKDPPATDIVDVHDSFPLVDKDTGNGDIFLTGFTLAKDYEWHAHAEITIDWCIVDCSSTYYIDATAGFNYAVGLRFPIQTSGTMHFNRVSGQESADVVASFQPINGTPDQFAATGLPSNLIFDGKELVAQFGAHGGFGYKLPAIAAAYLGIPPSASAGASVLLDLTNYLPAPFTGGHFRPPVPGDANPPQFVQTFDSIDLLGGLANYGVAGAVVNPAVKFELHSDDLHLTLDDYVTQTQTTISYPGGTYPLKVSPLDHSAHFAIGDPVYNLGLMMTPGIDPKMFIDLDIWSDSWDWPIWFPQASVELPPGGADFSCHDGTQCARVYTLTESVASAIKTSNVQFSGDLEQWKANFSSTWLPQCDDDACKLGVNFIRVSYALSAQQQHDANPLQVTMPTLLAGYLKQADSDAQTLVQESQARQTAKVAKAISEFQFALWSKQCSDSQCIHDLHGLLFFELWAMEAEQSQNPDESTGDVIGKVGPQFAKAAQDIIDKSKARAKAKIIASIHLSPPVLAPSSRRPAGVELAPLPASPMRTIAPRAPIQVMPLARTPAPATSTLCLFNAGPRKGQTQDYAPMAPLPIGTACQDGHGSSGQVVGRNR